MKLRIAYPPTISFLEYPDDRSYAITIHCCGCEYRCPSCNASELQRYNIKMTNIGQVDMIELENEIELLSKTNNTNKVLFTGGDPLYTDNIEFIKMFLVNNKTKWDICLYTGHDINYIIQNNIKGFKFIKTGTYIDNLCQLQDKTNEYLQFSSTNQKLYDSDYNLISQYGRYYFRRER